MVSKKPVSKRKKPAQGGTTKTARLLKSLELPSAQKPDHLPGSRLLGRKNRLDAMFSSQTEPLAAGTDIDSDTPEEIVAKTNFEEDDGFIYKRADKKGSKSKISTPISKLNQAISELPPDDFDDSFDAMDFHPVQKKNAPKRRKIGAGARLSSPIQSKYDDDYVEQVSHHTITLRGDEASSNNGAKRRTSYNKRGKRIASIGNGFQGLPHDDVAAQDFYKLLDTSLPEPHRMRQLLVWCSSRKLSEEEKQRNDTSDDQTAVNIAKVIKEEVLQDLRDSQIVTSWYNKPDDESDDSLINKEIVLPNPLNAEAAKNIKIYTKELDRLVQEKKQWQAAYQASVKRLDQIQVDSTGDVKPAQLQRYLKHRPDTSAEFADTVLSGSAVTRQALGDVAAEYVEKVETAVDRLYQLTHQMAQVHSTVERYQHTTLAPTIAKVAQSYVRKGTIDRLRDSYDKVWPVANTPVSTETLLKGITHLEFQGQQRA